ncbi:MAG: IclR family transcriptional regulator [Candidatus Rokubacteria bacterium]|nr:IclR family transcriptional regulator [Candidatus Rokubacteria bacterium]
MNRAVLRAIELIEALAEAPEGRGLSELARTLRVPKSSLWGIVRALEKTGLVAASADARRYTLGVKLVELGNRARRYPQLQHIARPFLVDVGARTGEAAFLAVIDQDQVLYIDKVESHHSIRYIAEIGTRRPLHCTASGKLYLASLPDADAIEVAQRQGLTRYTRTTITDPARLRRELALIRSRGYSVSREELLEGVIGLATPVVGAHHEMLAALNIAGLSLRVTGRETELAKTMLQVSRRLTATLASAKGQLVAPAVAHADGAPAASMKASPRRIRHRRAR